MINPRFEINTSNTWTFLTQVRTKKSAPMPDEIKIVDANLNIMGFYLKNLERVPDDVSLAASLLAVALVW